jgi:hypothetical protein
MLTVLAVVGGACTRVGTEAVRPGPAGEARVDSGPGPPVFQVFGGRVWLAGEGYDLTLEVRRPTAGDVQAILEIPELSVEARGGGTVSLTELFLEMAYGDTCPGTVVVVAKLSDDGLRGEGRVQARDCTGSESGAVSLLRRPFAAMGPLPDALSPRGP